MFVGARYFCNPAEALVASDTHCLRLQCEAGLQALKEDAKKGWGEAGVRSLFGEEWRELRGVEFRGGS